MSLLRRSGRHRMPADLGEVVTSHGIGPRNVPVEPSHSFSQHDPTIYAVGAGRRIPKGTRILARWTRNGQLVHETDPLIATREYVDTWIEFHIQPVTPDGIAPGFYTVQFFVNGKPGPEASFAVTALIET